MTQNKRIMGGARMALASTIRRKLGVMGALALGACLAPNVAHADTNLVFCNNTGARVYVALIYYQPATQKWLLSAWHTREPGQCKSTGTYRSGLLYYFAEKEGRTAHWPAKAYVEKTYCVPPTRVERTVFGGSTCPPNERALGFRGINATGATFTFNLNNS